MAWNRKPSLSDPATVAYSSGTVQRPERNYARSVRTERVVTTSNGGLADEASKYSIPVMRIPRSRKSGDLFFLGQIFSDLFSLFLESFHIILLGMQYRAPTGCQAGQEHRFSDLVIGGSGHACHRGVKERTVRALNVGRNPVPSILDTWPGSHSPPESTLSKGASHVLGQPQAMLSGAWHDSDSSLDLIQSSLIFAHLIHHSNFGARHT